MQGRLNLPLHWAFLSQGIGDTIRVSLTGPPVEEVWVAYMILASLGLRQRKGIEIISCPVCEVRMGSEDKAAEIEAATRNIRSFKGRGYGLCR